MDAKDILYYGRYEVTKALENLAYSHWNKTGVTTAWSVKDVMAHLASYELLLRDALNFVLGIGPTPYLDQMNESPDKFNEVQVGLRKDRTAEEVLNEYQAGHEEVMKLIEKFTPEKLREVGTIPWYGDNYSLDDFIVYASYGHIREHAGQIKQFRKRNGL